MRGTETGDFQQAYCMEECAVKYSAVPWFMSLINSLTTAHKAELFKRKLFPITSCVINFSLFQRSKISPPQHTKFSWIQNRRVPRYAV